jgi:hypothetical protein
MSIRANSRPSRRWFAVVALAFYTVLSAGAAASHHDFACHQKSRTHCSSCALAQYASGVEAKETGALPAASSHRLDGTPEVYVDLLVAPRTTGRSPPA